MPKKSKHLVILVIFLIFLCYKIGCESEDVNEENIFEASKDWKVVKKGQKIPKGLHVRINFETGLTEAKLLDNSEDQSNKKALLPIQTEEQKISEEVTPDHILNLAEVKKKIKNIKSDDVNKLDKNKFRNYDEIKKNIAELNLTPKTDAEIITSLIKKHKEIKKTGLLNEKEVLQVIDDLDFLVHQYDNAIEFVNQNGIYDIIYENFNSSSVELKKQSLKLLGSLVQNNSKPKIRALESGIIGVLLRFINFDPDPSVKSYSLTTLSVLLRSFPVAQVNFIENGGFDVLSKLFENDNIKLHIKSATLISDLIIEHDWAATDESFKYYTALDITKHAIEHNICEHMNALLSKLSYVDVSDHDSIEKCLVAMNTLKIKCGHKYERHMLLKLQKHYEMLALRDKETDNNLDSSDLFSNLKNICDEILFYVPLKTEL